MTIPGIEETKPMMKKELIVTVGVTTVSCCALFVLATAAGTSPAAGPSTCARYWSAASPGECASWIQAWAGVAQAVGAILALGVSVWISWRATTSDARRARNSAGVFIHRIRRILSDIEGAAEAAFFADFHKYRTILGDVLTHAHAVRLDELNLLSAWEFLEALATAKAFLVGCASITPERVNEIYPDAVASRERLDEIAVSFAVESGFRLWEA